MITHQVEDFASWKTGFDSNLSFRKANGEQSAQVYRDEIDRNKVTVVMKWTSLASAHQFIQSPDLKAAMAKTGVVGKPEISFVTEE
jgi:quinol monooxygenase YgiN